MQSVEVVHSRMSTTASWCLWVLKVLKSDETFVDEVVSVIPPYCANKGQATVFGILVYNLASTSQPACKRST